MTDRSVLFLNVHKGEVAPLRHWDAMHLQAALTDVVPDWCWFEEALPLAPPPGVVLISGQHHTSDDDLAHIRGVLDSLDRCVVIVHSDEASLFPWYAVDRPGIKWWISTPRHDVHSPLIRQARFFGEGPGPRVTLPPIAKDLDLAYMGQVNHVRRHELAVVCEGFNSDRILFEDTGGFLQGRPHPDYLAQLARAKVAPCPAGIESVDSFRLYQAIEAGCVPVVERFDRYGNDEGMWGLCYPDGVPFPVVDTWAELPTMMPHLLADHERLSARCQQWWAEVQQSYRDWLRADLGLTP